MNRRRSSMFDIEGSRRQSRMEADSSLSFNSSTELFRPSFSLSSKIQIGQTKLALGDVASIKTSALKTLTTLPNMFRLAEQNEKLFPETQQDDPGNDMRTTINWDQMKNQSCQNSEKPSAKF